MSSDPSPRDLLIQRARQFLVHSFLYYRLNESVISDQQFDALAAELQQLRQELPKVRPPHADLIDASLGPEASAFAIRDYPRDIVTAAFKLLYAIRSPEADFAEFVERWGYRAEVRAPDENG